MGSGKPMGLRLTIQPQGQALTPSNPDQLSLISGLARFTIYEPTRICWRYIHLLDQRSVWRGSQFASYPASFIALISDPSGSRLCLNTSYLMDQRSTVAQRKQKTGAYCFMNVELPRLTYISSWDKCQTFFFIPCPAASRDHQSFRKARKPSLFGNGKWELRCWCLDPEMVMLQKHQ